MADAGPDAEAGADVGPPCATPPGGNDLAFDLHCTGQCAVDTHFDFHLDPKAAAYPGCGDAPRLLAFADLADPAHPKAIPGPHASSLELAIDGYTGPMSYDLVPGIGDQNLHFELTATPTCSDGSGTAFGLPPLIIQDDPRPPPDGGATLDAGSPPYCKVVVTSDCRNPDGTSDVSGKLSCEFEDAPGSWSCSITGGVFHFAGCLP